MSFGEVRSTRRTTIAWAALLALTVAGCDAPVSPGHDGGVDGGPEAGVCAADLDCAGPRGQCGRPRCAGGACVLDNELSETLCDEQGGRVCDGAGACVECVHGAQCASGVCAAHRCAEAACDDHVINGGETDVDCGGPCPALCAIGAGCAIGADCVGSVCDPDSHTCAPSCSDGAISPSLGETDIDCGGLVCAKCALGETCSAGPDCASGNCAMAVCVPAPACQNGVPDVGETDIDCGGPACARCPDGDTCLGGSDCQSGVCDVTCSVPTCGDGVKNGDEAGLDCGLVACGTPCPAGGDCLSAADCLSDVCGPGMLCLAPSCNDGVKNGGESGVDCGAVCPLECPPGGGCLSGADCAGGVCSPGSLTCASTCSDGYQAGDETDLDCGGSCLNKCPTLFHCSGNVDCVSNNCFEGHCYP